MSKYILGESREQLVLFPDRLDSMVSEDNEVRVIDAFVEGLDLIELGIENKNRKKVGAPGYNPKDMLKLYLYGYMKKIRSSRKLMELTKINVEVMWLIRRIEPDFRCISDFRKDNIEALKKVFFEFNLVCKDANILSIAKTSQDGTKIRAVNAKDRNFTLNKLDDRLKYIKEEIDELLEDLAKTEEEERQERLIRLTDLTKRKLEYESYKKELEQKGESQKSLTDKDAKLMKNNGAYNVCFNTQVQVDTKSHMVSNYEVTDKPADFGSMKSLIKESEDVYNSKININITDNGYSDRKDMVELLENGTRPEVTPARGKESYILETKYEENEITEKDLQSNEKEDIKKCLRAGKIPEIYKKSITKIQVKEVKKVVVDEEIGDDIIEGMSEEEIRDAAMKEGIFIRNKKDNKVHCPGGCILRQTSKSEDGTIRYCNKLGCQNCKNPCTSGEFKEVSFSEGQNVVIPRNNAIKNAKSRKKDKKETKKAKKVSNFFDGPKVEEDLYPNLLSLEAMILSISDEMAAQGVISEGEKKFSTIEEFSTIDIEEDGLISKVKRQTRKYVKEKVVLIEYKIDKEELKDRMSTSEHCHGSMKRNDDAGYFLLKGKNKVNGEMALYYTAYNIRRATNIVGAKELIKVIKEHSLKRQNKVCQLELECNIEKIEKKWNLEKNKKKFLNKIGKYATILM